MTSNQPHECNQETDALLQNAVEVTTSCSYFTAEDNLQQQQVLQWEKQKHTKPNFFIRKPIWVVSEEAGESEDFNTDSTRSLRRQLSLFDLISIGVGATVGSGVFVLCGLIAHDYAGPATFISWSIAGLCACASGICYAELSGKFAVAGSSYSYVYVSMGELPAVITGACLTLEYLFSASAVSRSWGDKVVEYLKNIWQDAPDDSLSAWALAFLDPGYNINPCAFLVSAVSVFLLLKGVKESQSVTNFFTIFKTLLVFFMCLTALYIVQPENFVPLFPAKFGGIVGVMRGTSSSFFGFIGYDEICCMAGEAINPKKNLPRAVMGTIIIVTFLYVLAAIALVGMVPYENISVTSGFPDGFRLRGIEWASQISALGELITLPVVVLVTIMAQPRLQFAMATDGLLPPIFSQIDNSGNLWHGTLISGFLMVLIATCIPFTYLNDLISAGILLAFSLTDASVILLRQRNPLRHPNLLEKLLFAFNVISLIAGMLLQGGTGVVAGRALSALSLLTLLTIAFVIAKFCPEQPSVGNDYFETPFVPCLPLLGQFLNWYLIGQLEMGALLILAGYVGLSLVVYLLYGVKHSYGNTVGWNQVCEVEDEDDEDGISFDSDDNDGKSEDDISIGL